MYTAYNAANGQWYVADNYTDPLLPWEEYWEGREVRLRVQELTKPCESD